MRKLLFLFTSIILLTTCFTASAWDIRGGPEWQNRLGFGITGGFGGVTCVGEFCSDTMDTKLFGSFEIFGGAVYRLIPNLSFYGDLHLAHLNTDVSSVGMNVDEDKGTLFELIVGAAFHVPITGWLDVATGLGFGFGTLRFKGEYDGNENKFTYIGVPIELRIAAKLYLFSSLPTLGIGTYLKFGFPIWAKACFEVPGDDHCDSVSEIAENPAFSTADETPKLIHVGLDMVYGF